jgi:hypothetical protein
VSLSLELQVINLIKKGLAKAQLSKWRFIYAAIKVIAVVSLIGALRQK